MTPGALANLRPLAARGRDGAAAPKEVLIAWDIENVRPPVGIPLLLVERCGGKGAEGPGRCLQRFAREKGAPPAESVVAQALHLPPRVACLALTHICAQPHKSVCPHPRSLHRATIQHPRRAWLAPSRTAHPLFARTGPSPTPSRTCRAASATALSPLWAAGLWMRWRALTAALKWTRCSDTWTPTSPLAGPRAPLRTPSCYRCGGWVGRWVGRAAMAGGGKWAMRGGWVRVAGGWPGVCDSFDGLRHGLGSASLSGLPRLRPYAHVWVGTEPTDTPNLAPNPAVPDPLPPPPPIPFPPPIHLPPILRAEHRRLHRAAVRHRPRRPQRAGADHRRRRLHHGGAQGPGRRHGRGAAAPGAGLHQRQTAVSEAGEGPWGGAWGGEGAVGRWRVCVAAARRAGEGEGGAWGRERGGVQAGAQEDA